MRVLVTMLRGCLLAALVVLASPRSGRALDVPDISKFVNDYAGVLDQSGRDALTSKLATYRQATGHEFALLTVRGLDEDIATFAIRAVDKWKVGDAKRDDGLLVVLGVDPYRARIEVGMGLQGEITDVFSAQIIRDVLGPARARGRPDEGIHQAFDLLMAKANGVAVGVPRRPQSEQVSSIFPLIVFGIVLLLVLSRFGGGGGGGRRRRRGGVWVLPLPGGFGGGGGWGGGGGGGGWGGGGGGDSGGNWGGGGFNGGGASGDW